MGHLSRAGLDLWGWQWSHQLVLPLLPAPISISTRPAQLSELGYRLSPLRLPDNEELLAVRQSLARHGQLQAVVVFEAEGLLEVIDGFKRVHAARALGWSEITVTITRVHPVDAKVHLLELQQGRGLCELEEGFVVQSLHREDGLSQGAIAQRIGRHKSWVCRRLLLAEGLDPVLHSDLRLGLLKARVAVALAALPRGNQPPAAEVASRRGLTVRQTTLMVAELQAASTPAEWQLRLTHWREGHREPSVSKRAARVMRSQADAIATDIASLCRIAARLEARLLAQPLIGHGLGSHAILSRALEGLGPVLDALTLAIRVTTGDVPAHLQGPASRELT